MSVYGDVHRRFLQSFVYHPVQSEEMINGIIRLVCRELESEMQESIQTFIGTINRNIRRHTTLEIKTALCELTGEKFYVAVNNTTFRWTKTSSTYTMAEQSLFKKIIDEIVGGGSGNASTTKCLNFTGHINMTKVEASNSISKFVKDGWFSHKEGMLYMGVRSIAELEQFVLEMYGDLVQCPLCKTIIFWGAHCQGCASIVHFHCLKKYFASTTDKRCPNCEVDWSNENPSDASS